MEDSRNNVQHVNLPFVYFAIYHLPRRFATCFLYATYRCSVKSPCVRDEQMYTRSVSSGVATGGLDGALHRNLANKL